MKGRDMNGMKKAKRLSNKKRPENFTPLIVVILLEYLQ